MGTREASIATPERLCAGNAPPRDARLLRRVLATAALLGGLASHVGAEELVRLVAPAPAAALVAGAEVTVEWVAGPALATFVGAEEWELFLSLDGGATYLARLTPHLDLDVRRVTIRVPDTPGARARLMVRVGDERIEREQEFPGSWPILAPPVPPPAPPPAAVGRGEPARPQAPGVLVWVEGRRDGSGRVERRGSDPATLGAANLAPGRLLLPAPAHRLRDDFALAVAPPVVARAGSWRPLRRARRNPPDRTPSLAVLCRRNE